MERVGAFAKAVNVSIDAVSEKLTAAVGEPGEEALAILADPVAAPDADLKAIFAELGIPVFVLNKNLGKLRGKKPSIETKPETATSIGHTLNILPSLPDDESFIKMLKTDGELKVGVAEVLSAVKAAIAKTVGLYEFPEKLLAKMEQFAESQEQPCGKDFFEIQKLLTTKNYADVLSVIGVPGTFVSTTRKNIFMARVDELLWPALKYFQEQVVAWEQQWLSIAGNPAMMIMALTANKSGGALPANMTQSPDTSAVRTAGEEVINIINKVFAGPGIPVARAMAYDATRVTEIIAKPEILAQAGFTSKDMMLKELGISVGSDLVRVERGITQYVLSIMSLPEVALDSEALYLSALANLGKTIDFGKLSVKGLGGRKLNS